MILCRLAVCFALLLSSLGAQQYVPARVQVPAPAAEFRAAWSACVYNIDWPSRAGLSAKSQQLELIAMLDKMASLRMNALIFQVRSMCDAMYTSRYEPWSQWLTGAMGRDPGYDPLAFCIREAQRRGIEVHAWFNPFRALPNKTMAVTSNHVTVTQPNLIREFKNFKWMDISQKASRDRALSVMLDVIERYDIDGVHIDDYFYPYPDVGKDGVAKQNFPDGKTAEQRRAYVDSFVQQMYKLVKNKKPWVRVGISPFGIWRPGVPAGTTAGIDSVRHLHADSRKWLAQGWCDYMMPQLYWRIEGPQSFPKLLSWWRAQGSRPVWPGIATTRIKSTTDRGRTAEEMVNQIALTRSLGKGSRGHCHWSVKALLQNRGGINQQLQTRVYREAALVPAMPWLSTKKPTTPQIAAAINGTAVKARWAHCPDAAKYVVQALYGQKWITSAVVPRQQNFIDFSVLPAAIAVRSVDRFGTVSSAATVVLRQ